MYIYIYTYVYRTIRSLIESHHPWKSIKIGRAGGSAGITDIGWATIFGCLENALQKHMTYRGSIRFARWFD